MSTLYFLTATDSGIGGVTFHKVLSTSQGSSGTASLTVAQGSGNTDFGRSITGSDIPGSDGITGDYAVKVNIATGDSLVNLAVRVHRANSAGTIQQSSSFSSEQGAAAGTLTYNFTSLNLGTWGATDRLLVEYRITNTQAHGGNRTITFNTGHANSTVQAPWDTAAPATDARVSWAELFVPNTAPTTVDVDGTADTAAAATGELTVEAPGETALDGAAAAAASATATLSVESDDPARVSWVFMQVPDAQPAGPQPLDGSTDTAGTATASLSYDRWVSSWSDEASATTHAGGTERALDGTAVVAGWANGTLDVAIPLDGSADTAGYAAAELSVEAAGEVDLAGTANTAAAASGEATVDRGVTGSASTAADASGTLSVTRGFDGTASSAAHAAGELTVTEPGITDVDGSANTAAYAVGALSVARSLAGSANAAAWATATLSIAGQDPDGTPVSDPQVTFSYSTRVDGIAYQTRAETHYRLTVELGYSTST